MSFFVVSDLRARVKGREILKGVNISIEAGEVHVIMGPNGSGKSTLANVLAGMPGYSSISGSVKLRDVELLELEPWQRARNGLYLSMQSPIELPGVEISDVIYSSDGGNRDALADDLQKNAMRLGLSEEFLKRSINVDFSGGEQKRNEMLMMLMLDPVMAILDETDSGLDVDALKMVSKVVEEQRVQRNLGVLIITHHNRILSDIKPDFVHVFANGKIMDTGDAGLADEIERQGYERYGVNETPDPAVPLNRHDRPEIIDVWGGDPVGRLEKSREKGE